MVQLYLDISPIQRRRLKRTGHHFINGLPLIRQFVESELPPGIVPGFLCSRVEFDPLYLYALRRCWAITGNGHLPPP